MGEGLLRACPLISACIVTVADATLDSARGDGMPLGTRSRPARRPPRSAVPVVSATANPNPNPNVANTGAPEETWLGLAVYALMVLSGLYFSYKILRVHPDQVSVVPPPRSKLVPFEGWRLRSFMPF
jgi:hypothetical protein